MHIYMLYLENKYEILIFKENNYEFWVSQWFIMGFHAVMTIMFH